MMHGEVGCRGTASHAKHPFEVDRFDDARHRAGGTRPPGHDASAEPGSDGQALAPLGAASVDDGPAAAGFHPDEEAVGARTPDFGGLVSTFHDWLPAARDDKTGEKRAGGAFEPETGNLRLQQEEAQPSTGYPGACASRALLTGVFPCG